MEKSYKEIEIFAGCSIEEVVKKLVECNDKGEFVCACFNGHMLYSDTVTIDLAYLDITGKSKTEFDKDQEEMREKYRREEEEHKSKIPELAKDWIEKGHKILDEVYWTDWDNCVPIRLDDLYKGMELKCCLDIIQPLNNGCNLDMAKEIIEGQNHSGMSFGLVRAMVKAFCDRGQEFAEYVS